MKGDLQKNRLVVANLFKEVEDFHESQEKHLDEEMKDWEGLGGRRI